MKKPTFILFLAFMFILTATPSITIAKTRSNQKRQVRTHNTHKKSSKEKSLRLKKPLYYYVAPLEENLRKTPSGKKIGSLERGTAVKVKKIRGKWALVTIKAWIWLPSLSKTKPKAAMELLISDIKGSFGKHRFVIKGKLSNQTRVAFKRVVLLGELFKGKKRVAHKKLILFSKEKPLQPGNVYPFYISFKKLKGYDSYGVRILTASEM